MIGSFKDFLSESEKTVYFAFGRMNPPTAEHEKFLDELSEKAGKYPYRVFLSTTHNSETSPLQYESKLKFVRKMFPRHARSVVREEKMKTPLDVAVKLYNEGFTSIVMVASESKYNESKALLEKYNGKEGRHGFYEFSNIRVEKANSSLENTQRHIDVISENRFPEFASIIPNHVSTSDARELFNCARKGMNLHECKEFKNKIEFQPVSEEREKYVQGEFDDMVGECVYIKETGEPAVLKHLGSNYVIVELNGEKKRCWIEDIVKEKPGVNWRDLKRIREQDMTTVRNRIQRDKKRDARQDKKEDELMKRRHDQMLDRARRRRTRKINRGIDS